MYIQCAFHFSGSGTKWEWSKRVDHSTSVRGQFQDFLSIIEKTEKNSACRILNKW